MHGSQERLKRGKAKERTAPNPSEQQRATLFRFGAVLIVIGALVSYRVGGFIRYPFADGDLFWQRRLGEFVMANHAIPHALGTDVFSAPGAPWTPQEWVFSCIVALAFDHGALWALAVFCGVLAFATLAIAAWRAMHRGGATWAVTIACILAAVTVAPNFALRAEVLVWPLLALSLLILDEDGPVLWLLIPVTLLWANLHASVFLMVPVVWLSAALRLLTRRPIRTLLALSVIIPLTTLCTPFGVGLPLYAVELLHSPLRPYIAQWRPIPLGSIYVRYGFIPLAVLVAIALIRRVWTKRPLEIIVACIFGVLSWFASRNAALFGIVAIVPAALAMSGWAAELRVRADKAWIIACEGIALVLVVVLCGWYGVQVGSPGIQWPGPFGTVKLLAAHAGEHRLLCAEYSWCSVALGQGATRIFLDGRADPYPPKVWEAFGVITHARPGWRNDLALYDVNAVIAWRGGFFESQMQALPDWYELTDTGDACCVLFLKL